MLSVLFCVPTAQSTASVGELEGIHWFYTLPSLPRKIVWCSSRTVHATTPEIGGFQSPAPVTQKSKSTDMASSGDGRLSFRIWGSGLQGGYYGVPMSWSKTAGGDTVSWVGFELLHRSYQLVLTERRVSMVSEMDE